MRKKYNSDMEELCIRKQMKEKMKRQKKKKKRKT